MQAACARPSLSEAFLVFSFQKIMKRLIKRYVLKAQVDRENDEVNEGERPDRFPVGRRESARPHQAAARARWGGLHSCPVAPGARVHAHRVSAGAVPGSCETGSLVPCGCQLGHPEL